jgi:two-component system capsular synthesis sensor histidine kinase RcsC
MPDPTPRVLIIENHDALRVMLFTVLRHQTLKVDTASTAAEALVHVGNCDYALILLDMGLPDDEANTFLDGFRQSRPDSTSFVLAVRDPKEELTIDSDIVAAVVTKPLELNTLAEAIRECALVVPPPDDPLPCPPTESELKGQLDRAARTLAN